MPDNPGFAVRIGEEDFAFRAYPFSFFLDRLNPSLTIHTTARENLFKLLPGKNGRNLF